MLPSEPRPELVEFVASLGLELFWQDGKRFRHVAMRGTGADGRVEAAEVWD